MKITTRKHWFIKVYQPQCGLDERFGIDKLWSRSTKPLRASTVALHQSWFWALREPEVTLVEELVSYNSRGLSFLAPIFGLCIFQSFKSRVLAGCVYSKTFELLTLIDLIAGFAPDKIRGW